MNLHSTLRRLIVSEVVLLICLVAASFIEEQFLPQELRSYLDSISEREWTAADWMLVAFGIPLLGLLIVSWVALWRGWRSGRTLYTVTWVLSLPFYVIGAPFITGPIGSILETLSALVSGLLLGLLYFSELRHTFESRVA